MFSYMQPEWVISRTLRDSITIMNGVFRRIVTPSALNKLPTPGNLRYQRANARLRVVVDRIIDEYRRHGVNRGDLLSVQVPDDARAESATALNLAIRVIVLANDLGSLRADVTPSDDPDALVDINTVVLAGRVSGSVESAVQQAVTDHNALVRRFRALVERGGPDGERLSPFLAVVRHVVNGNLRGTRYLTAERYPGSSETLRNLDPV
jgi:hypothetical protein